ncbi:helix-turn-helix transcriptional regulator [Alkaliphilus hydrothermalis]|uniref:Tetratricopeptide (TPR) repeat protein n=1 Tax=Alkaliphilus hydrothermalis TaxID=1482730 RepID=A0ABS2NPC7_9FIRM|nr:helix-turn-helix transcriptional regulator [Alkaliphilus hydrothermalis]MBM7614795.1 tetratricopeptide (TPR) repeat protein [Alkaliphilus hydrothermalis]
MEILSAGEKIKKLRCDLGLKQDDVTNEEVTKSLISMIENNKRSLSWNTAQIIAGCLNRYYSALGKEITPEFLMETEMEQARKIIEGEILHLQPIIKTENVDETLINRSFEKMVDLANQWGLQKEIADLYILKGQYYYYSFQYNKALKDYSDGLEYYMAAKDYGQVAHIYNLIGATYHKMMLMNQALLYYSKAYDMAVANKVENIDVIKVESIFNQILCYRKIHKYDMALQQIYIFKELKSDEENFNTRMDNVILMEANIHRDLKNYERAERMYNRLLAKGDRLEPYTLFLVYENLTTLFRELGQIEKALKYIEGALELKERVSMNYLPNLYLQQAKCFMQLGEDQRVISILENGILLAETLPKKDMVIDLHFAAVQAYGKLKDYQNALRHLRKSERIIVDKDLQHHMSELNSFYIEVYLAMDEKHKCMEYITRMRNDYLN